MAANTVKQLKCKEKSPYYISNPDMNKNIATTYIFWETDWLL